MQYDKPYKDTPSGLVKELPRAREMETPDEAALLGDIRFALRGLNPWPPKGTLKPSEQYARKVVEQLKLCGWQIAQLERALLSGGQGLDFYAFDLIWHAGRDLRRQSLALCEAKNLHSDGGCHEDVAGS